MNELSLMRACVYTPNSDSQLTDESYVLAVFWKNSPAIRAAMLAV